MRNRLLALMLVLMFSVTTLSVLPITTNITEPAANPKPEVNNTLADGETYSMRIPILEDEAVVSGYPSNNYDGNEVGGGLFVGNEEGGAGHARPWIKFDLSNVPEEIAITRAVYKGFLNNEYNVSGPDKPIGIYYSEDNSWSDATITWNTQPTFSVDPVDVIDSPASPGMFVSGQWYEWDVTSSVMASLNKDKILSLMMKEVEETVTYDTWKYFVEEESTVNPPTHLELEYVVPGLQNVAVDGRTSSPLIDYIQDDCPDFSWDPVLQSGDFQRDFELEIWNNTFYNDSMLMQETHSAIGTFFSGGALTNYRPFGTPDQMIFQFKYTQPLVPRVGIIDKLYFEIDEESGVGVYEDLSIFIAGVDSVTDLTSDFAANYEGREPVQVLYRESYSAVAKNNWLEFDIENLYMLTQETSLIVEFRFTNNTGYAFHAMQTTGQGGSVAYTFGDINATTALHVYDRTHGFKVSVSSDLVLDATVSSNWFPFGAEQGYDGRFQLKYNQSLIGQEGLIDKLYFICNSQSTEITYENLSIYLLETPVKGELNGTVLDENYGGRIPTLVLDAGSYTVQNIGHALVIDVNNVFFYSNTDDLLIEIRWDDTDAVTMTTFRATGVGGYRAYDLRRSSVDYLGSDDVANSLFLEFIYDTNSFQYYSCFPLVNGTEYYLRVRISDSTGVWSDWSTKTFKYEELSSVPEWEGPIFDPNPAVVGTPVTVSINVTYFLGINSVEIDLNGTDYAMTGSAGVYEYTWTPTTAGNVSYTIYMESEIGTVSSVSGIISVVAASGGIGAIDPMLLALIGAGVVVTVIVIVIFIKRSKK